MTEQQPSEDVKLWPKVLEWRLHLRTRPVCTGLALVCLSGVVVSMVVTFGCTVKSIEIDEMSKEDFRDFVSKSIELTNDEKATIQAAISDEVYSHCRLVMYRRGWKRFMDLDQFYPRQVIGTDSGGHTLIEGGSGNVVSYEYVRGQWQLRHFTFYY